MLAVMLYDGQEVFSSVLRFLYNQDEWEIRDGGSDGLV